MQGLHSQAGFSLIELLVSMTIFTVVMTMATSTLLVLLDANSKAQNMQAVMNDLTIAIDSMTREIRTGYNYVCNSGRAAVEADTATNNCSTGQPYISVVEAGDSLTQGLGSSRISYYYDSADQVIYRRVGDGDGDGNTNEDEDWIAITAPNINITATEFIVTDTTTGLTDGEQPSVTVFITGEAGDLIEVDADFLVQTTVVQRPLDI